jgi:SAM-dependent methyltransferase
MLHHLPEPPIQNAVFREMHRLLRRGGIFIGVDSLDLEPIRLFHVDDTFVPMDPAGLPARLHDAGFSDVVVDSTNLEVRFTARKS